MHSRARNRARKRDSRSHRPLRRENQSRLSAVLSDVALTFDETLRTSWRSWKPEGRLCSSSYGAPAKRRPRHTVATAGRRRKGHLIVAHYEVVGKGVKDSSVPAGRSNTQSLARMRPRERRQPIDRPRDGSLLKKRDPPLRSGLLSNVPPGLGPLRMLLSLMSTRMNSAQPVDSVNRPARPRERALPGSDVAYVSALIITEAKPMSDGAVAIDWAGRNGTFTIFQILNSIFWVLPHNSRCITYTST
jgi:hypothetical protein